MPDDVTVILDAWAKGDASALDRLTPLVYPQLHALAQAYLRRGARPVTLQTTAVVNELFIRLLARQPAKLENRRHFYVLAARIIRAALVDHYRHQGADKRGGDRERVPLHDEIAWVDPTSAEMLTFEQAMSELEQLDPVQADLFGMRFLLGCTAEEAAELTGLSKATVDRKVRLAKGWLFQRVRDAAAPENTNT